MDLMQFKPHLRKKNLEIAALKKRLKKANERNAILESRNKGLNEFYDYFKGLHGQGLQIANWHQNGDLEPFDDFFDSAAGEMQVQTNVPCETMDEGNNV